MTSEPDKLPEWRTRAAAVVDPSLAAVALSSEIAHEVFQHARECYPEEACGLLVGPRAGSPVRIERCTNVQERRRRLGESDLAARHGYWMDEKELMLALRRVDEEGNTLLMIYHSHVDTEAYFSHADLAAALGPDGTPLYPGVAHLVIAVYEDGVRDATGFVWSDELARYRGHAVQQVG